MRCAALQSEDGEASSRTTEGGFPLASRDAAGGAKPGVVRAFNCQAALAARHRNPVSNGARSAVSVAISFHIHITLQLT